MKKLVLIDGHALVHRAFHALPPTMTSPSGVMTNAVYGFISVLLKTIKDLKPDYIVATFDLAGPTFRHEEFAEYKAHREKAPDGLHEQVPTIKEVLSAFGVPIFEKEGFEADDMIGSICEKTRQINDLQTIIATGDLDTLQLVQDDKVVVLTMRKGMMDTFIYNEKEVGIRYGLKPDQLVDYRGLKGDPSDNIPGVAGVGEKTGSELIKKFKTLEELYEFVEKNKAEIKFDKPLTVKLVQKLLESKDMAFFSKKLSTITRDVPIDFNIEDAEWREKIDQEKLKKLFQELGFYSLVKRIGEWGGKTSPEPVQASFLSAVVDTSDVLVINSQKSAKDLIEKINKNKELCFDIQDDRINIIVDGKNYHISLQDQLVSVFKDVLEDEKIRKIGHDLKIVIKKLLAAGIHLNGIDFDTRIAAYLLNSEIKDYSLEKIYFNEFAEDLAPDMASRPTQILELKAKQLPKLKNLDLLWLFEKIELPLEIVLAEMESAGITVDLPAIAKLAKTTVKELASLEKKIHKMAGEDFNINSPKQLSVILFEKMGITGKLKKTGKGVISTAAPELEKLAGDNPIIDLILKYREIQKLKSTYIEPFPSFVGKDGRVRTTYNQTMAATGRLSSEDPNLQNIPIRTELGQEFRKAFVAGKGFKLVSFDYSQIELRIAAHISGDKKMSEAFKKGEDIHTRTAAEIFGVPADKVEPNMRRDAKVLNFGILYGMGILGFQRAVKATREQARGFIERYMQEFTGVARYMQDMKDKAHRDGFVTTIFGRRRQFPEIKTGMPQLVSQAERMAINHPIQGTAADLLKLAMIAIHDLIHKKKAESDIKMLLQVHDELLFEIKDDQVVAWSEKIKEVMENTQKLNVPLTVDVKSGINWSDSESLFANN